VNAFIEINQVPLNYEITEKRPGDVIAIYADNKKAQKELGWNCNRSINDMMHSAWLWEQQMEKESE
ncbi:MAG TPA: UDP-glucose 4-epimerase GalE, partial [Chitinophagales bacterium]|nr:UDP-glucose 4-epimerase GalE [Chitinophagales bacterium]